MSVVFKTTVNRPSALVIDREAMAAVPIDQEALLNALGDAMGILAAEQRKEREQQVSELREKIAAIEGKVEVLMSLMQGKGQLVDLPPLPKLFEGSSQQTIRKLRSLSMKGMVLSSINDVRMAQLLARELGLRASSDVIDQLVDQFAAFRREREQQLAALKAEFDEAIAELQAELDRTKAEYAVLKLLSE